MPGPRRDRAPAAQRGVLRRLLPGRVPQAGRAGDRRPRHVRSATTGSSSRSPAARTPWRSGTSCSTWLRRRRACTWASGSATTPIGPHESTAAFAAARGATLRTSTSPTSYGFDIPTAGAQGSRSTCAVCGLSKRYVFNRAALEGGFDVVATGHNLDDEAATLLGNTLRWQTEYIARQSPVLPARDGLGAQGQAAVPAVRARDGRVRVPARHRLRGGGVPARGRQHAAPLQGGDERDRGALARGRRPSSSSGYLDRACRSSERRGRRSTLTACERCGQPTTGRFCAFCRARAQILGERLPAPPPDDPRELAGELSEEVLPGEIYGVGAAVR